YNKLLNLGAATLFAASAAFAAPGNRVCYAYTLGSAEFADATKDYDYGFVAYPFDPSEDDAEITGTMLDSYYADHSKGVFAGAGVDGILYACEYTMASGAPVPSDFVMYNTFNGTKESIGLWNPMYTAFKPQDMTWSEKDQKMYALGFEQGTSALYEVDLNTAKFTLVCYIKNGGGTLAAAPDGTLYSLSSSGVLYTINPQTGSASKVMDTGLGSMLSNQSMEFDKASGLLYWVSSTSGHPQGYENSWLQEIDVEKKTIRQVGTVGIGARILALHIPSAADLLAPAAPQNVKSEPATDGSLSATISWINPETTLNGSADLGTLYGYVITRNGEIVKTANTTEGTFTPGELSSWVDNTIPATGEYRYDIYFFNAKGNGAKGTVYQYIGPDAPGYVSGIKGEVGNNMRSLKLSWNAPTAGYHLGAFDPSSVKYKVVRSDNVVVSDALTECSITDEDFIRVMKYSYTVTAYNDHGSCNVQSGEFILGPAFELPFEQTFEDDARVQNLWTAEDANDDGFTWYFNTTLGQAAFGDFESAAEYIVSPGLGNSNNGSADEWLISPPLAFEAGVDYEVTVSSRSYTTDQMEIWLGDKNYSADMTTKAGDISIVHDPENPDIDPALGTVAFRRRSVALPSFAEDAIKCIGLHLVTVHPDHAFLQINGIYVGEKGEFSGVEDILASAEKVNISLSGKSLAIFGSFRAADLYDLSGRKVLSTASAVVDLSLLPAGVYVLNVDGNSFKLAL
ncbi:MAG: choice-of-anchor J domain-containing protein, partial [Muribaculaceae bacterium]|nr:choice-of-anchor J domain-containing protein [Muribaculaceae bacterium]